MVGYCAIGKWLNAGIQEGMNLSYSDEGTPQGGVISHYLPIFFSIIF